MAIEVDRTVDASGTIALAGDDLLVGPTWPATASPPASTDLVHIITD